MISEQKPKTLSNQGTRVSHCKASLRPDCDQLTRTSWGDASLAYAQIQKGRAAGNKRSLCFRIQFQSLLTILGCYIYKRKALFFFMSTIPIVCLCMTLMSSFTAWDLTKLWVL
ncbi:protein patched 1, partial [Nephila pilipes]